MNEQTTSTPPYVSFRTFWNFISELHEHQPLPQVMEGTVLGNRSGGARSQLVGALRFFELIDADRRPTQYLRALVSDPSIEALRSMLERYYPQIIELGLDTATPGQVDAALREMGAGQGSTMIKTKAFFIHAASEAGFELGRHLKAFSGGTSGTTRRPKSKKKPRSKGESEGNGDTGSTAASGDYPLLMKGLLEQLPKDDQKWSPAEFESWLPMWEGALRNLYVDESKK